MQPQVMKMKPVKRNVPLNYYVRNVHQTPDGITVVVGQSNEDDDCTEVSEFCPFANRGESLSVEQARLMAELLAVETLMRVMNRAYYGRLCGIPSLADVEPIVSMEPDLYTATEPA